MEDIKFFIDNECLCLTLPLTTHYSTFSLRNCNFSITNWHNSYWLSQSRQSSWWIWIRSRDMRSHTLLQTSLQKLPLKNFSMILYWNSERQIVSYTTKENNSKKKPNELEKYFGIKKCRTTLYHAMDNGMVKRLNSTVIQMLQTLSEKFKY